MYYNIIDLLINFNNNYLYYSTFRPIFGERETNNAMSSANNSNLSVVFVEVDRRPVVTVNESNIYEGWGVNYTLMHRNHQYLY